MTVREVRAKICGVTRPADAHTAEEAGAAYVGAVLWEGSSRRVTPDEARPIAEAVSIPLVIVTAGLGADEVGDAAARAGARVIQLHGDEDEAVADRLRELGDWELWKAVRVRSGADIRRAAERFASSVDLLLLDGWHPRLPGGTGKTFAWEVLEELRDELPSGLRLGVAGGLDPDNVARAIRRLSPDLVDVSSGVEARPGIKDPERVRAFLAAVLGSASSPSRNP